ncbi:MAG TPA: histidine--tRNA ligase [Syntrophomonadaceae bacterium]|nr:histidine--tRNA ligase [Syntrophomonadaceae bacterium]HQA06813.1 histidine--tRNA ligase [Syntrophomonadaceae bacterium]
MQIKAPRGTYDILPDEAVKWQWMEQVLKETAERFGYRQIRTPMFEHTELFQRGVGESTDIVTKEMYTFQDKSQRSLTLRPEGTASCARALIEHSLYNGTLPVKWYYIGPMFRYDRPQTGRYRQFHQFGVEAFGSGSPYLDAEILFLLVEILRRLGLPEYELHLNSVGCSKCREQYRQKLIEHITPVKERLCADCQVRYLQNPLRVLDCKEKSCHQAIVNYPTFLDSLCDNCRDHYTLVQKTLQDNGIKFVHDDNLVRGLDYYTNTAFEVHIPGIGAQSAVGGGGRYDGLVESCGGPSLPGIGFALGLERLLLALNQQKGVPWAENPVSVFIAVMQEHLEDQAAALLFKLRQQGIATDKDYNQRSSRAQMKLADKLGVKYVVLLGEEEVKGGFVTVRDMKSKEQWKIDEEGLVPFLQERLDNR